LPKSKRKAHIQKAAEIKELLDFIDRLKKELNAKLDKARVKMERNLLNRRPVTNYFNILKDGILMLRGEFLKGTRKRIEGKTIGKTSNRQEQHGGDGKRGQKD
jgi:hypothetical protein